MERVENRRAAVVVSGGLDSVTPAYLLHSEGYDLHLLAVDYGQRHIREIDHARRYSERLGTSFDVADISGIGRLLGGSELTDDIEVPHDHYAAENMAVTVVPNRNAIILSIAYGVAVPGRPRSSPPPFTPAITTSTPIAGPGL